MRKLVTIFKALSDETRLRVLKLLEQGELCVCDIVAALDMVQPKVSFHLAILKEAGFIKDRKEGRWTRYRIDDSEMFRKYMLSSVLDRIPPVAVKKDRSRLCVFLKSKSERPKLMAFQHGKNAADRE